MHVLAYHAFVAPRCGKSSVVEGLVRPRLEFDRATTIAETWHFRNVPGLPILAKVCWWHGLGTRKSVRGIASARVSEAESVVRGHTCVGA